MYHVYRNIFTGLLKMKKKALRRQSPWCCSSKHRGRIGVDKSNREPKPQILGAKETDAGRKGLIQARAALSPDSPFPPVKFGNGEKKDSCIINALIMIIFCARLIHVKPSLCQIENWHFCFMNIAPSVTFIVRSQSCNSECQVNYQALAFLSFYFRF